MSGLESIRQAIAVMVALATLVVAGTASAQVSPDEIEVRVRQIYFEGYPVADSGPLDAAAIARLGEMLEDPSEEDYWSNIVLALGASENDGAYPHLADFAARQPTGEASTGVYQARVALRVALGQLAYSHPPTLGLLEELARNTDSDPGWSFQSLRGESLAGVLRRSAITGLAISGRPEAATVLSDLKARAAGAPADQADELRQHLDFATELHGRVASDGPANALRRKPVTK